MRVAGILWKSLVVGRVVASGHVENKDHKQNECNEANDLQTTLFGLGATLLCSELGESLLAVQFLAFSFFSTHKVGRLVALR